MGTFWAMFALAQLALVLLKQGVLFDGRLHTPIEQWTWLRVWTPALVVFALTPYVMVIRLLVRSAK